MPDYSNTRIQFRRGSSSQWAAANTILASGEPGIDQNSGVFKVGDGVTGWNSLSGINFSHHSEGGGGDVSVSQLNATNTNVSTVSGISVFSSGQSIVLQTSVGLLNTSSGVLNTSVGAIEVFNDISSGIAVFASGKALSAGDVSTAQFNIASGIGVFSSGQSVALQTSVGLVNTSSGALNTSVGVLQVATGLLNTSSGALNTSVGTLQVATGLLNTSSGSLNTSVGAIEVFNDISSGIGVFSSGQSVALQTSVGLLQTSSGVINTSVGLLQTSSGVINTSVGLLETSSGVINTSVGAIEVFNNIVSGVAVFGSGNNTSSAFDLDVTGSGRVVHADGKCGLLITDTLGSGLHIGDCALNGNGGFTGMKHSNMTGDNDYMIVSNSSDTLISAIDGGSVFLRAGGNNSTCEIRIHDVGAGGISTIFNEGGSDRDIRMEGASEVNLLRLDASTDRIGIKSAVPSHSLSVSGTLNANEIFISGATAVQTSPTLAKSSGTLNVSGINNLVFTDLAGHSGIAVKDTQTLYFIVNN